MSNNQWCVKTENIFFAKILTLSQCKRVYNTGYRYQLLTNTTGLKFNPASTLLAEWTYNVGVDGGGPVRDASRREESNSRRERRRAESVGKSARYSRYGPRCSQAHVAQTRRRTL